jgi:hypothetical protein
MRELLFWLGCIPTRSYITYRSSIKDEWNDTIRVGAFVIAWWLFGMETGTVGRFGGPAFWAPLRPVHGALWGMYAMTNDWRFLAGDTGLAVVAKLKSYKP